MRVLIGVQSESATWSFSAPVGDVLKNKFGSTLSIFHAQPAGLASVSLQDADFFAILGSLNGAYERHIDWIEAKYSFSFRLVTIGCMKWGSEFTAAHVNAFCAVVRRNIDEVFDFVCLTDVGRDLAAGIDIRPMSEIGLPEPPWMLAQHRRDRPASLSA